MPKKLSEELLKRLQQHGGENESSLPINYFVTVDWPLDGSGDKRMRRCYSTFEMPVTMDGYNYTEKNTLLDFNERTEKGFVMSSDHLIYGASCGFRVFDSENLASRIVNSASETQNFPPIRFEAWLHFSNDTKEIESLVYGDKVFSSYATRLEMQMDGHGRRIVKVWGGHEGIVVSKTYGNSDMVASVVERRISLRAHMPKLLSGKI